MATTSVQKKSSWLRKGFLVYIFLSLVVLLTLFFTTSGSRELRVFLHLRWAYLAPLLLVIFLRIIFDGLGLQVLVPKSVTLSLSEAIKIRLMGIYFAVAVPISSSHVYFQAYLLSRYGLGYAESLGLITLRTVLPTAFFIFLIPLSFFVQLPFGDVRFLHHILQITALSVAGIVVLILAFLLFPRQLAAFFEWIYRLLLKIRLFNLKRYEKWNQITRDSVWKISRLFQDYVKNRPGTLVLSLLYIVVSFLFEFLVAPCALWLLGFSVPFAQLFFFQFFLKIIVQYAPTPGGSGVDELTYAGLFALFLPKEMVAIAVFVWRFFHAYLLIFLGAILTFLQFGPRTGGEFRQIVTSQQSPNVQA